MARKEVLRITENYQRYKNRSDRISSTPSRVGWANLAGISLNTKYQNKPLFKS
jgi:hypothetical protein